MDFAARYRLDGVLAEGWNLGWEGDWTEHGDRFSFPRSYPDLDMDAIVGYGRQVGVKLIGHNDDRVEFPSPAAVQVNSPVFRPGDPCS